MSEQKAADSGAPNGLSDAARAILEQAGLRQQPPDQVPQKVETQQTLSIKVGGVDKVVPLSELQSLYEERSKLSAERAMLDEQLARVSDAAALKRLQDAITGLPPERQAAVFRILNGADDDAGDDDQQGEEDDIELPGEGRRADSELAARLAKLEQGVFALANHANENHRTTRMKQVEQKVMDQLKSYKQLFGGDENPMRDLAMDSVMAHLTANPEADIEKLVQASAQKLQQSIDRARSGVVKDMGLRPQSALPQVEGGLTGAALKSGRVRDAARRYLAGL